MIAQRETVCVAQSLLQKAESSSSAIFLVTHDDPNNRFSLFRIMLYQRIISRISQLKRKFNTPQVRQMAHSRLIRG
jgi:hypothetical protein